MSQWLEQQFIHYEQSEGGDTDKRERRIKKFIQQAVLNRFPHDTTKQTRTETMIQTWRANTNYPSYEEMLRIFSV